MRYRFLFLVFLLILAILPTQTLICKPRAIVILGGGLDIFGHNFNAFNYAVGRYSRAGWDVTNLEIPTKSQVIDVLNGAANDPNLKAIDVIAHGKDDFFAVYGSGKEIVTVYEINDALHGIGFRQLDEVVLHVCYLGNSRPALDAAFNYPKNLYCNISVDFQIVSEYWEVFHGYPSRAKVSQTLRPVGRPSIVSGSVDVGCGDCDSDSCFSVPVGQNYVDAAFSKLSEGTAYISQGNTSAAMLCLLDAKGYLEQARSVGANVQWLIDEISAIIASGSVPTTNAPSLSLVGLAILITLLAAAGTYKLART